MKKVEIYLAYDFVDPHVIIINPVTGEIIEKHFKSFHEALEHYLKAEEKLRKNVCEED